MSWQSDIDAWLLGKGVVTAKPCPGCGEAIKPGDTTEPCKDGTLYHRICFNIAVASLECELEACVRDEGWTMRVSEDGRELWTPPEDQK